jgi:uncharacterized protein YrrD
MLILATDLLRLPVASADTNSRVGTVNTLLIDTDKSLVIGFLISIGFLSQPKYLAIEDIRSIDHEAMVIQSLQKLIEPKEVIRARKVLDEGIKLVGQVVKTESGKRLGKVSDLLINTETGEITKYYVGGWLADRIVPAEKIVKITKQAVIVEDEGPVKAEPVAAAAA